MNKAMLEYIEFFYKSKDKKIKGARKFLASRGLKIEDLMKPFNIESKEVLTELIDKVHKSGGKMTKKQIEDYLQKSVKVQTKGLTAVDLASHFARFKEGYNIKKGSIPQMMFGCGTCPYTKRMNCPHDGKHANGGCAERYQFFAYYIKQTRGATIPLMQEHLAELKFEAQQLKQSASLGEKNASKEWIALTKVIVELEDKIHKGLHGVRHHVRKDVTVKDIRKAFHTTGSDEIDTTDIIDAEFEELKEEK